MLEKQERKNPVVELPVCPNQERSSWRPDIVQFIVFIPAGFHNRLCLFCVCVFVYQKAAAVLECV